MLGAGRAGSASRPTVLTRSRGPCLSLFAVPSGRSAIAKSRPASPQAATTRTSVQWKGLPRNPACIPARKCLSGKIRPTQSIQAGGLFPSGMKTPDRKSSGRMTALTIGCEASAFGMTAEIARPERAERGRADDEHDQHSHQGGPGGDVSAVERAPERGRDRHQQHRHELPRAVSGRRRTMRSAMASHWCA